jgi:glycerol-3-phosphate O-acyltransferase/dihydroxyacetone phosphate acyltransferase
MRPLYFILKNLMYYGVNLFFRKKKVINAPKEFNAQTIFVVNHASAFLDPWVIAELQRPILFFLARGDIFKAWLKPITWAAHMIPIYRTKENGADSAEKNQIVFQEVYRLLHKKKSILIFGEGYTDDVFIRSLKPLKKGPARIGFGAMEACNWQEDIKIQSSGINYADPNKFRSDVLIANADPIHLIDYKESYLSNPTKTILELTLKISDNLQSQLTYLENPDLTELHNHIQSITKKGIAHNESDRSIPLEQRWKYSQKLASIINKRYSEASSSWQDLKTSLQKYFESLQQLGIKDQWVLNYAAGKKTHFAIRLIALMVGLPLFIIGCFHHLIPYLFLKRFTEKTFKRRVFWSGIKLTLGYLVLAAFNIALCLFVNAYFDIIATWILWLYIIFIVPLIGLFTYQYAIYAKHYFKLLRIKAPLLASLHQQRENCVNLIQETVKMN